MQLHSCPTVKKIADELAALRDLPRDKARTMSPDYYTAPEFLELEKQELFRKEWICIGHEGEIPHTGDYFTTDLADEPLLVVRGQDREIRVLSNVCRHRGNLVAKGSGNAMRFTCGYHAWSYGPDGQLLAAPLMDKFSKTGCQLPNFSVEIWKGFIFVSLQGKRKSLASALVDLEPYVHNYQAEKLRFLYGAEETWATNWKCLAENFMEGYHLSPTHPQTLWSTPTSLCEKLPGGAAFTGYRSGIHESHPLPAFCQPNLSPVEKRSGVLYCIYPNLVFVLGPGGGMYMCLRPLAVGSVGIRWGAIGLYDDAQSDVIEGLVQNIRDFSAEDRATLEGLYKGLQSRYYSHGPLAGENYEGTIWDILQYMASRLGTSDSKVC